MRLFRKASWWTTALNVRITLRVLISKMAMSLTGLPYTPSHVSRFAQTPDRSKCGRRPGPIREKLLFCAAMFQALAGILDAQYAQHDFAGLPANSQILSGLLPVYIQGLSSGSAAFFYRRRSAVLTRENENPRENCRLCPACWILSPRHQPSILRRTLRDLGYSTTYAFSQLSNHRFVSHSFSDRGCSGSLERIFDGRG